MPIETTPVTIAAQVIPEKVYNVLWYPAFAVIARDPSQDATLHCEFQKATASYELLDAPNASIQMPALFAAMGTDTEVAQLIGGVMVKCKQIAVAQTAYQRAKAAYEPAEGEASEALAMAARLAALAGGQSVEEAISAQEAERTRIAAERDAAGLAAGEAVWPYLGTVCRADGARFCDLIQLTGEVD